tara:strand:- start:415 stop:558 length:144 start_codon:yes stop_codon:yes gene_type:complete
LLALSSSPLHVEARAGFDVRITPNTPVAEFDAEFDKWIAEVNKDSLR